MGDLTKYASDNGLEGYPASFVFETKFLRDNNCANLNNWYNFSNNTGNVPSFGSEYCKELYMNRYGVPNPSMCDQIKIQKQITCFGNYGVPFFMQSDEGKQNYISKCLVNYGTTNAFNSPLIIHQIRDNCYEEHGVYHHQSRSEIREKISNSLKR